ncbi:hypothetical protein HanIR_Chr12g0596101 [Helianthus annuus]|nr:hypothetical protein HanIR_Chr12g0596101 [Helianthus annuus]
MYNYCSYMYSTPKHKNTFCTRSARLSGIFFQKSSLFVCFLYRARHMSHKAQLFAPRVALRLTTLKAHLFKPSKQ